MRLPRIAPLTRREAQAARLAREGCVEGLEKIEDPSTSEFLAALILALDEALEEYSERSWVQRLVPQPAGHLTRLRPWLLEVKSEMQGRLDET